MFEYLKQDKNNLKESTLFLYLNTHLPEKSILTLHSWKELQTLVMHPFQGVVNGSAGTARIPSSQELSS